jgi:hypothetical protein
LEEKKKEEEGDMKNQPQTDKSEEELIQEVKDCDSLIKQSYEREKPEYLYKLYLKKGAALCNLNEYVWGLTNYQKALNLQTEFKQQAPDIFQMMIEVLRIYGALKWRYEFGRWIPQIEKTFHDTETRIPKYMTHIYFWKQKFENVVIAYKPEECPDIDEKELDKTVEMLYKTFPHEHSGKSKEDIKKELREMCLPNKVEGSIGLLERRKPTTIKDIKIFEGSRLVSLIKTNHGRGIKAKADIAKGSTVIKESPIVSFCKKFEGSCSYCGLLEEGGELKLFECPKCGEKFCSEKCYDKAWDEYHSFECNVFGKHIQSIKKFIDRVDLNQSITNSLLFMRFFGRIVNESDYPERYPFKLDLFKDLYIGNYTMITLFNKNLRTLEKLYIEKDLLYRYYGIFMVFVQYGRLEICKYPYFNFDVFLKYIAMMKRNSFTDKNGIYLFKKLSFVNHSCIPNAKMIVDKGIGKLITLRKIKKGEEIKVSYVYTKMDVLNKLKNLERYGFLCKCKKCKSKIDTLKKNEKRVKKKMY